MRNLLPLETEEALENLSENVTLDWSFEMTAFSTVFKKTRMSSPYTLQFLLLVPLSILSDFSF